MISTNPGGSRQIPARIASSSMFYNDFESELEFLLDKGAPSIKYLVRRDFMDCDRSSPDMLNLQALIFEQPNIKKLLSLQHADGWLGCELHGNN